MAISTDGPEDAVPLAPVAEADLVNRIAASLSTAIVSGRFAPGDRLNEVHLAAELGVSRAPLREAARLSQFDAGRWRELMERLGDIHRLWQRMDCRPYGLRISRH